MALEAILQAIADDAETQVAAILGQADADARARLQVARAEAEERRQAILQKATVAGENECSRMLHRARLDVSRMLVAAQEEAFQAILTNAKARLAESRSRPDYPAIFAALLRQALEAATGTQTVAVNAADATLAASLLGAASGPMAPGLHAALVEDLDTWGGVVVRSEDGRIVTMNTLESRLDRALPDLRPLLSPLLMEAMSVAADSREGGA